MVIPVTKNWYDTKFTENMYCKDEIELKPGLTVLIGCNGSGKTTLLSQIKELCRIQEIPCIGFNNIGSDASRHVMEGSLFKGDLDTVADIWSSSEGEQITIALGKFAGKIGRFVRDNIEDEPIIICIDAADSGYSIDNVIDLKEDLFKLILDDIKDKEVYIIISANEYELCIGENVFSVYHGEYVDINSYEDYKKIILESRIQKEKRYGKDVSKEERYQSDYISSVRDYIGG